MTNKTGQLISFDGLRAPISPPKPEKTVYKERTWQQIVIPLTSKAGEIKNPFLRTIAKIGAFILDLLLLLFPLPFALALYRYFFGEREVIQIPPAKPEPPLLDTPNGESAPAPSIVPEIQPPPVSPKQIRETQRQLTPSRVASKPKPSPKPKTLPPTLDSVVEEYFSAEGLAHNKKIIGTLLKTYSQDSVLKVLEELNIKAGVEKGSIKIDAKLSEKILNNLRFAKLQTTLSNREVFNTSKRELPIGKTLEQIRHLLSQGNLPLNKIQYLQNAACVLRALGNRNNFEGNPEIEQTILVKVMGEDAAKTYHPPKDTNTKDSLIRLLRNTQKLTNTPQPDIQSAIKQLKFQKYESAFSTIRPDLSNKLAVIALHLEEVKTFYGRVYDEFSKKTHAELEKKYGKKFLVWMDTHYSYTNMRKQKMDCVNALLKLYSKKVLSEIITLGNFAKNENLEEDLNQKLKELSSSHDKILKQIERQNNFTLQFIQFIFNKKQHILIPYDQGKHESHHVGEGTCYADSAIHLDIYLEEDPLKLLQTVKKEERTDSSKARMLQLKYQHHAQEFQCMDVKDGDIVSQLERRDKAAIESSGKMRHMGSEIFIKGNPKTRNSDFLIAKLEEHAATIRKNGGAFLLGMVGKGGGHAIDIKIDHDRGIYIIRDNNIGLPVVFIHPDSWGAMKDEFTRVFPGFEPPIGDYEAFKGFLKVLVNAVYKDLSTGYTVAFAEKK